MSGYFIAGCSFLTAIKGSREEVEVGSDPDIQNMLHRALERAPAVHPVISEEEFRQYLKYLARDVRTIKALCERKLGKRLKTNQVWLIVATHDSKVYGMVSSGAIIVIYPSTNPMPLNKITFN